MAIKKQVNLTVSDTALNFTVPSGIECTKAVMSVETAPIRVQLDGTAATGTNGLLITHAQGLVTITGREAVANFSMIRDTSSDATVNITYFDSANGLEISGAK